MKFYWSMLAPIGELHQHMIRNRKKESRKEKRVTRSSSSSLPFFFFLSTATLSDQNPSPPHATDHHTPSPRIQYLFLSRALHLSLSCCPRLINPNPQISISQILILHV
jgi:hypothetical protein